MLTQHALRALAATVSLLHLTNALPGAAPAAVAPYPLSVLYTWSATDATCKNTASKGDCTTAINQICSNKDLTQDYDVTVGECKAIFMVDPNNSIPSKDTCTAAYTQILTAGIGGSLGYNDAGNRTLDPLYVIYPTSGGNGNCFKKTGDTSPVLAANVMPNGQPLGKCSPPKTSRALSPRETPVDDREGAKECLIEDVTWGSVCTAACMVEVALTSWAGPFAFAGGLACFGGCEALGWKLYRNCMVNKGQNPDIFDKRALAAKPNPNFMPGGASGNVCLNLKNQWAFDCPAMEASVLGYHQCDVPGGTTGAQNINAG